MKVIKKKYNKQKTEGWYYYEIIMYNNIKYTRFNFILGYYKYKWFEGYSEYKTYANGEIQLELETAYQCMLRIQKLKNILDENYI